MLKDVVEVRTLGGHRLYLRFEDGVEGEIDVGDLIDFRGVFRPLRDETEFAKVHLDQELGAIGWPSGAELDPDVLYAKISRLPIRTASPQAEIS